MALTRLPMRLLLIAAAACVVGSSSSFASENDDLCVVLENIEQYEGQNVVLRGDLRTDFTHIAGITDPRCPASFLAFGPERYVESGSQELWFATQRMRREGGSLHLTAVGVIGPGVNVNGVTPRFVLNVHTFSDLDYVPAS